MGNTRQKLPSVVFILLYLLHRLLELSRRGVEIGPQGGELVVLPVPLRETVSQFPTPQLGQPLGELVQRAVDLFEQQAAEEQAHRHQRQHQSDKGDEPSHLLGPPHLALKIPERCVILRQKVAQQQCVQQPGQPPLSRQRQCKHENMRPKQALFHRHIRYSSRFSRFSFIIARFCEKNINGT